VPAARLSLVLPLPPSVNHSHGMAVAPRPTKRLSPRVKKAMGLSGREDSDRLIVYRRDYYTAWIKQAGLAVMVQRPKMPVKALGPGRYGLRVRWPEDMRGDVSNRVKALEDFLVYMRMTPDDKHERILIASFSRHVEPDTCAVTVWTLGGRA
jgi:hypothetical protein